MLDSADEDSDHLGQARRIVEEPAVRGVPGGVRSGRRHGFAGSVDQGAGGSALRRALVRRVLLEVDPWGDDDASAEWVKGFGSRLRAQGSGKTFERLLASRCWLLLIEPRSWNQQQPTASRQQRSLTPLAARFSLLAVSCCQFEPRSSTQQKPTASRELVPVSGLTEPGAAARRRSSAAWSRGRPRAWWGPAGSRSACRRVPDRGWCSRR